MSNFLILTVLLSETMKRERNKTFLTEKQMIAGIGRRDETAMAAAIETYSRLLWKVASAVLTNTASREDIEECVADTFVYLWRSHERFSEQKGSLKSWLCLVARSRAIDRYRAAARRNESPLDENTLMENMGPAGDTEKAVIRREALSSVNTLDEPDREIVVRRYFYQQKPKEISVALGLSVRQVENRLYRSKARLREQTESAEGGLRQ